MIACPGAAKSKVNVRSGVLGTHNADEAILWKAHWVDIDVALNGIRHRRPSGLPKLYQDAPASCRAEECVLEGVGVVGYAPKAAGGGSDDNRFAVRIGPDEDNVSVNEIAFDLRSPCHVGLGPKGGWFLAVEHLYSKSHSQTDRGIVCHEANT